VSGKIQEHLHYPMFFAFVVLVSLPTLAFVYFAPFRHDKDAAEPAAAG
jgi:hypothetical protein